jgi:hypothetical protein
MNYNNYTVKQHAMHHKFLQYTFVIVSLFFSTITFSQTEQDVISEANRLGLILEKRLLKNYQQEVLVSLKQKKWLN